MMARIKPTVVNKGNQTIANINQMLATRSPSVKVVSISIVKFTTLYIYFKMLFISCLISLLKSIQM